MKSLKGRILLTFCLFLVLFGLATLFSYKSLEEVSRIRGLQDVVSQAHNTTLNLINKDLVLRTNETIKHEFYSDPYFPAKVERQQLFDSLSVLMSQVVNEDVPMQMDLELEIGSIYNSLEQYDSIHNEIMNLQLARGFRDDGLEGELSRFIGTLETYKDLVSSTDILRLRRIEKDYFLSGDSVYVERLFALSDKIRGTLSSGGRNGRAKLLLEGYTNAFRSVVSYENRIGDNENGLIKEIIAIQTSISEDFARVSSEFNEGVRSFISARIRVYSLMVLGCFAISGLIGFAMAHYVSIALNTLAQTMKRSLKAGKMEDIPQPLAFPTWETESLYQSYQQLLETINQQMIAMEKGNQLLEEKNHRLIEMNRDLAKSEFALKESNEMKEKFLSIIGHDLKGPMATMMMMINLLVEDIHKFNEHETKQFANNILKSSQRISLLMENLLAWSRSQVDKIDPHREKISVAEVVEANASLYELKLVEKEISLRVKLDPDLHVWVDRNMFDFVVRNLLDNAVKFTHEKGTIDLKGTQNHGSVEISFADTGTGMAQENIQRLFTSINTSHGVGTSGEKGTGLGLVLCNEFVERNNGTLTVETEVGKGSTFKITLPVEPATKTKVIAE